MRHRPLLFVGAAGFLAAGCASSPSAANESAAPPSSSGWVGTFQPTQERTGVLAPTRLQQAGGTVRLRQSVRDPQRTTVALAVSTALQEPTALRWAVLPGRCGAGSLPLLSFEQFPPLDVTSSGRGQLEIDVPIVLPESGSYHVNVYHGGTQITNVLTCATLRRG
jgi:hypothetical protein